MRRFSVHPRHLMLAGVDLALLAIAWIGAYVVRFEFAVPDIYVTQGTRWLPAIVLSQLLLLVLFGAYRNMWRYTALPDLLRVTAALVVHSLLIVAGIGLVFHFHGFPRTVFIMDLVFSVVLLAAARAVARGGFAYASRTIRERDPQWWRRLLQPRTAHNPTLVVGDLAGLETVLRETTANPDLDFDIVGAVTVDPALLGRAIHGIRFLGLIDDLCEIVEAQSVETVLLISGGLSPDQLKAVTIPCEQRGIAVKVLPVYGDVIRGRVSMKQLRDIAYEDLLGRSEIRLDTEQVQHFLSGRTILVSGGGGSIGAELCRQVIRFDPGRLVVLDASEKNLFDIEAELHHDAGFNRLETVLGRVQDEALVDRVFAAYRPHVVFHAAAYKHVPFMELHPWQAVTNNVVGSFTIMAAADRHGCERFVMVSTDKAVRPTNVMGASKRFAELVMHSFRGSKCRFMGVRFGNVLGSSGSVVPLFRRQIERGGPVTVTHPEITRFFMTIPEAAQLILQAGALADGGEIFILEMGTPIKIAEMARDLIVLSGKEPDTDIKIEFTGLRPGEKLYEELITEGEGIVKTHHERIYVIQGDAATGFPDRAAALAAIADLREVAAVFDAEGLRATFQRYLPEYQPWDGKGNVKTD